MRHLFFSLLLLSLLPIGLVLLILLALESTPKIGVAAALTHQDIDRARTIITQNNPYRLKAGALYNLSLSEKDLTLAANYLIKSKAAGGAIIKLLPGRLTLQASIKLPDNPVNNYINLQLSITEAKGKTTISRLRVGQVPVPGRLADFILVEAVQYLLHNKDQQLIKETIKKLTFSNGTMQVVYKWKPELITRVTSHLISEKNKDRIRSYYRKMAELTRQPGLKNRSSLIYILRPLFTYAQQRSKEGDPVAENRAALIVLAAYILPENFNALMPRTSDLPLPRRFTLSLNRRKDFVEHFAGSAALAAIGDAKLADAVGLHKEVADSKGRSGFSFTDLAADRAGARFGEIATRSAAHARRVQSLLAKGASEEDLMPKVHDLPENITAKAFEQRFKKIGSPEFNALKQLIEQRIDACRLYRKVG